MIDKILAFMRAAIERRRRDFMSNCATIALVAMFGSASLGFGVFAAYLYLSSLFGGVIAALIFCAACAVIVIAVLGVSAWRKRNARLRRTAAASPNPSPESLALLVESLLATGVLGDQKNLLAATRLGAKLKPLELVALALVGGFIVSRKLDK